MNKNTKVNEPQPLRKNIDESKQTAPKTGPSMGSNHQPVSENDNSANLFEDHIRETKKD